MSTHRQAVVVPWSAPLRAMPHKDTNRPYAGILKDLAHGTQVTVLGRQGDWLHVKVTINGKTFVGYVAHGVVRFAEPTGSPMASSNTRPHSSHSQVGVQPSLTKKSEEKVDGEHRNKILDGLQTVLDFVGFIPGIGEAADLTNAGISALRGHYLEAALSLISVIPGVGDAIGKGAKYALKFADVGVARKALAALKSVDLTDYLSKITRHPQFARYAGALRQSLLVLEQKLTHLARGPTPQFAMAGGGHLPSAPMRSNVVQMSAHATNGYKRGDHVFNNGLTKLGLDVPKNSMLGAALSRFQSGLKNIELMGGFNLVANKGAHAADLNSTLFGNRLTELRDAWAQLDRVLSKSSSNVQHRAEAVKWAMDALKRLRQASFDEDAVLARVRGASSSDARKFQEHVKQTARQLDEVFNGLTKELEKLMPSSGAVGLSMSGYRGRAMRPRR